MYYQRLNTDAAQCWKFFSIENNVSTKLAIFFVLYHSSIQRIAALVICLLQISKLLKPYILRPFQFQFFLAVANYGKTPNVQGNSTIFKWHKRRKRFKEYQIIPTWTARDFEHFVINDEHFLAVANHAKGIIWS